MYISQTKSSRMTDNNSRFINGLNSLITYSWKVLYCFRPILRTIAGPSKIFGCTIGAGLRVEFHKSVKNIRFYTWFYLAKIRQGWWIMLVLVQEYRIQVARTMLKCWDVQKTIKGFSAAVKRDVEAALLYLEKFTVAL